MKKLTPLLFLLIPVLSTGQFDYYGPQPFHDLLNTSFNQAWSPTSISNIENRKYVVILDQATQTNAVVLNSSDNTILEMTPTSNINGAGSTYGSMMRSVFQIVDENTHFENDPGGGSGTYTPLSGMYKLSPVLHSFYNINADVSDNAISTDGGTYYIDQQSNTGYVLIEFVGSPSSTKIKAVSQWEYNSISDTLEENTSWTTKYLMISGSSLTWTTSAASGSDFFLADATDLLDMEIADGSDFNPMSTTYQPNATAAIPSNITAMSNSMIITQLPNDIDVSYTSQLGNSASATTAASTALDDIETTLINNGAALRYPKSFYLALRENMLSHVIGSTDIFNGVLGNNTVEHVYFTNAFDDNGVPHPFMVIASHAASTRPNLLLDVNRPPGATPGAQYAQSEVTRHGKLGEFLVKIPLKDYGLISTLLDNDLTAYGDLATDFDAIHGTTTTKDVYNYTSIVSIGMAVDGVTIYPAQNNNLRFAVEDAEVTSSGIHVGGGLELHYHADGHAFNGNGINLYNLSDYTSHDHPPVIGIAYDGIALFGRYDNNHTGMAGYSIPLDAYGGHDHGDGFGYHYHAHTETVTASTSPFPTYDEHFLMVGAWKGDINDIPGFLEVKTNQLMDASYGRFAGASYTVGIDESDQTKIRIYPNPTQQLVTINVTEPYHVEIRNMIGELIQSFDVDSGNNQISLDNYANGIYIVEGANKSSRFTSKLVIKH